METEWKEPFCPRNELANGKPPTIRTRFLKRFCLALALISAALVFGTLSRRTGLRYVGDARYDVGILRRNELSCKDVIRAEDQCRFVQEYCVDENSGHLAYLSLYYCNLRKAKWVTFILLMGWFSTLVSAAGIVSSDFLCVNLSTLASLMGLSESLSGITLLALGNGGPDLFSALTAFRTNNADLAFGVLIGSAAFIATVVAGSMAFVRPFKVAKRSFVRDLLFFIVAVVISIVFLSDGKLQLVECVVMICYYAFYVLLIVIWHWILQRRRERSKTEAAARAQYYVPDDDAMEQWDDPIEETGNNPPGEARYPSESTALLRSEDAGFVEPVRRAGTLRFARRTKTMLQNQVIAEVDEAANEDDNLKERHRAYTEIQKGMRVARTRAGTRRTGRGSSVSPNLLRALEHRSVTASQMNSPALLPQSRRSRRLLVASLAPPVSETKFPGRSSGLPATSASRAWSSRMPSILAHSPVRERDPSRRYTPFDNRFNDSFDPADTILSEITRNMHVSRWRPRRNQGGNASIRPSLAGALEFRSVLAGLEKAKPNQHPLLRTYSNDGQDPRYLTVPEVSMSPEMLASPMDPSIPWERRPSVSSISSEILLPEPAVLNRTPREPEATQIVDANGLKSIALESLALFFPTLSSWNEKETMSRLIGILVAPIILLLTLTTPVCEVESLEDETDPPGLNDLPLGAGQDEADSRMPTVPPSVVAANIPDPVGPKPLPGTVTILPSDTFVVWSAKGYLFRGSENIVKAMLNENDGVEPYALVRSLRRAATSLSGWRDPDPPINLQERLIKPAGSLSLLQAATAPTFLALVFWINTRNSSHGLLRFLPLFGFGIGVVCVGSVLLSSKLLAGSIPRAIPITIGFAVSITWIFLATNEAVGLLHAFGIVLNISDTILGITIFALGNSLGDLVADITVAKLGYPVMALSACFGGPMVNILVGFGGIGLYTILSGSGQVPGRDSLFVLSGHGAIPVDFNLGLAISAGTLLVALVGLLILVPWNGWVMDRKIGWFLMLLWVGSIFTNVALEIASRGRK
ncbi:hypothetical protein H2200_011669 [Cladophialophora chaetospira]|uniref:Sodium/calcium exchanger membrane region domain-containing protein n=1 Tax=Cladophialophora chaetospira TaxID=386627 RepID=A0AA39CDD2_9EURO|nr:hypothetical protein H2200_011669 [Cladophialophora chaetospira]